MGNAVIMHIAVDLHAEELGGQEQARLTIPAWRAIIDRVGGEGAAFMLVHANGNTDVILARANAIGGHFERGGGGGAAIVHVHERNAGATHAAQHRIGIVHLAATTKGELDIFPGDAGITQRGTNGIGTHVDCRFCPKTPEGVHTYTQNDYVAHGNLSLYRLEGEGDDLRVTILTERHNRQFHLAVEFQLFRIAFGQPGFNPDFAL